PAVLYASGPNGVYKTVTGGEVASPATGLIVMDIQFDRMSVVAGASYSATVSGPILASDTFFDVRFTRPGSNGSAVALNWQRGGFAQTHDVPADIAPGVWTINGVRAHRVETDHTGGFVSVSATITVSPLIVGAVYDRAYFVDSRKNARSQ